MPTKIVAGLCLISICMHSFASDDQTSLQFLENGVAKEDAKFKKYNNDPSEPVANFVERIWYNKAANQVTEAQDCLGQTYFVFRGTIISKDTVNDIRGDSWIWKPTEQNSVLVQK